VLSRGWLKASHRELDSEKSKPWQPYHPHRKATPVVPGEINEYAIEIRPIANLFKKGHRIKIEIWSCDYPLEHFDLTLLWPNWSHLSYEKETSYKIYHSANYPSRITVPIIPRWRYVLYVPNRVNKKEIKTVQILIDLKENVESTISKEPNLRRG